MLIVEHAFDWCKFGVLVLVKLQTGRIRIIAIALQGLVLPDLTLLLIKIDAH